MSYHKFKKNDIFHNRIKSHPTINLVIHSGNIYYNNKNMESGSFTDPVTHVPNGYVSLYELNIDRPEGELIYPFISKDGSLTSFKTVTDTAFNTDFLYGDEIAGTYPLSASISRDYITQFSNDKKLLALKTSINYYRNISSHFQFSGAVTPDNSRDLLEENVNLISIPSIFYGSKIDPGTIELKFYVTGTLVGHVKDEKRNGELVQVGPEGSSNSGSVVGISLYNEGFLILTASHALSSHTEQYPPLGIPSNPNWLNFATTGSEGSLVPSSSFDINFNGTTYVPVLTMLAHAKKADINHSNNITFLDYNSFNSLEQDSGSIFYREPEYLVKNTIKSPYNDPSASFERQVYISRIGIYDKDKNLIAIAKLATPIRKRETDSLTFKLKLDI